MRSAQAEACDGVAVGGVAALLDAAGFENPCRIGADERSQFPIAGAARRQVRTEGAEVGHQRSLPQTLEGENAGPSTSFGRKTGQTPLRMTGNW